MRRKNTKFIDPRHFMDEKMEEVQSRDPGGFGGMHIDPTPTKTGLSPEQADRVVAQLNDSLGDAWNWILEPSLVPGAAAINSALIKLSARSRNEKDFAYRIKDYLSQEGVLDQVGTDLDSIADELEEFFSEYN
tara:strand:- start:247 stop:645 length:399 start_codon:yes stop_codon:yes gene_type:complete